MHRSLPAILLIVHCLFYLLLFLLDSLSKRTKEKVNVLLKYYGGKVPSS